MTVQIPLSGRVGAGLFATIDAADAEHVQRFRWHAHKPKGSLTVYARTVVMRKTIYLHRLVSGALEGDEIDHIDGNGLNNCQSNLRRVTHSENIAAAYRRARQKQAKDAFDLYEARL